MRRGTWDVQSLRDLKGFPYLTLNESEILFYNPVYSAGWSTYNTQEIDSNPLLQYKELSSKAGLIGTLNMNVDIQCTGGWWHLIGEDQLAIMTGEELVEW